MYFQGESLCSHDIVTAHLTTPFQSPTVDGLDTQRSRLPTPRQQTACREILFPKVLDLHCRSRYGHRADGNAGTTTGPTGRGGEVRTNVKRNNRPEQQERDGLYSRTGVSHAQETDGKTP